MSKHKHGLHSTVETKVKSGLYYLAVIFLFIPGVRGASGRLIRESRGLLGGLLTIYYIVAIVVVFVGGLNWIARVLE